MRIGHQLFFWLLLGLVSICLSKKTSKHKKPTNEPTLAPNLNVVKTIEGQKDVDGTDTIATDIDTHGCVLSSGQFWCESTQRCTADLSACEMGRFDAKECTYRYTASSFPFTYDLSPLSRDGRSFYKVTDVYTHKDQEYDYYFNFCRSAASPELPGVCRNATSGTLPGEKCTADAMAYQHFYTAWNYSSCYRLSSCYGDDGPPVELGLIDPKVSS